MLGSAGRTIPLFRKQGAEGGPAMVTDLCVLSSFMTILEAVQLVRESASRGKDEEIFVLDVGKSARIVDLASDPIRL